MHRSVILGAARTPFGRLLGGLAPVSAVDLGVVAARGAIERSGIAPAEIAYCVFGTVIQAGQGHIPSRQVSLAAGLRDDVGSDTVNKVCASGMRSIALADALVRLGEYDTVLAGGMESMSNAPHLAPGARKGYRFGDATLVDSMIWDALRDPWSGKQMFEQAAAVGDEMGIERADLDAWSARSHARAIAAIDSGRFAEEIVPVVIAGRNGDTVVDTDEGPRSDTTADVLAKLRPAFGTGDDATVTAGNASSLNDGGAAVVVTSLAYAEAHGLPVLGRIRAYATGAVDPQELFFAPVTAVKNLMKKEGKAIGDYGLIEANEAFASQALADGAGLAWDWDRVNVNGGAIALGHPIGASGARVLTTLLYAMQDRNAASGLATLCLGGGDAVALSVTRDTK